MVQKNEEGNERVVYEDSWKIFVVLTSAVLNLCQQIKLSK
jgi:hypothetical protein